MTAGRQWQPAPAGGVPPAKRHGHSLALVGVADALRHHPPTDAPHPALSCLLRLSPGTSAESCNAGGGSGRRPPRGGGWVVGTILWSRGHRPGRPGAGMGRPAMRRRRVATPPAARPPQRRTGAAATAAGRRSRVEPGAGPRGPHGAQGVCVRGGWEAALLNQNEKKKKRKRRQPPPRAVRADAAVTPRSLQRGGTKAADVTPWAQDRRGRAAGPAGEPPHAKLAPLPPSPRHTPFGMGWCAENRARRLRLGFVRSLPHRRTKDGRATACSKRGTGPTAKLERLSPVGWRDGGRARSVAATWAPVQPGSGACGPARKRARLDSPLIRLGASAPMAHQPSNRVGHSMYVHRSSVTGLAAGDQS